MLINFTAKPLTIGSQTIIKLPKSASEKLSSRGMAMAQGTINSSTFTIPLEPDGMGSHWFNLDSAMLTAAKKKDPVALSLEPIKDWSEPIVPTDLKKALSSSTEAKNIWTKTTVMARWDWIRWVRSTNNPETREKRVKVAISKMEHGEKRPCCFNRSSCTVPEVSKGGVLVSVS